MTTFTQVATSWKADKRQYIKASSYAIYIHHLNKSLIPHFGELQLVTENDIQQYVNKMLGKGLSLKSVKDSLLILKMILRYGEKTGAWPHTDFSVHFPTVSETPKTLPILSIPQQKRLTQYLTDNFSFRNLGILIVLHTGMRIGEICALQWQDIDLAYGVIHITKTVQRICVSDDGAHENYLSIGSPKTISSTRDIPIAKSLLTTLRPLVKIMRPDHFVVSNSGRPFEPRYYREYFRRLLKTIGIPPLRFHALRHSFATRCIESKCDYKTASVILGHASISTTLDLYVHPGYSEKKQVIDKMTRMLAQ